MTTLGPDGIGPLPLARLLIRYRLRSLWNGLRARGRGRIPVLALVVGVVMSVSYVGLFAQSFSVICENTDVTGQVTALAMVALTIAFGSYSAKAASSEAVLAGSPENEFMLARPVALPSLVIARCLAESATDPLGALFLLPVLLAATLTWHLPAWAIALAAVVSMLVQLGISGMAQATQIALVRFVPRPRRRAAWMVLGLVASLSLASLWMMMTRVLRAPASVATGLAPLAPLVAWSPGAIIVGPLAALVRGGVVAAFAALGALAAATAGAVALAAFVARRAGMAGWEEAGATWSDATAGSDAGPEGPAVAARPRRVLTAATKDLALITRDRTRLLTLVSMPVIFVGVQLFGTAGWDWSTATLARVSHVAFSLTLYMVTIGPLAHMQAERRAFWIMRAAPISVGRLLAAKAKAWSIVIGGVALLSFAVLSLGTPGLTPGAWLEAAVMVVGGSVGMTWLAIALAAGAADLSDEQRPAIGPVTIYTFMLIGGLYNVVLAFDRLTLARGIILYLFAIAAYWAEGVRHATVCLDAEAARERRVALGDGAAFIVALTFGKLGIAAVAKVASVDPFVGGLIASVGVAGVLALAAALYLARRRGVTARGSLARAAFCAIGLGVLAGVTQRLLGFPEPRVMAAFIHEPLMAAALILPVLLGEELVLRGVLQRGLEEGLAARRAAKAAASIALSAAMCVVLAVVAGGEVGAPSLGVLLTVHISASVTRALTGRWSAAFLARVVAVLAAVALGQVGF